MGIVNTEFVSELELKRVFVKAAVSRAVRLPECPLREHPLYSHFPPKGCSMSWFALRLLFFICLFLFFISANFINKQIYRFTLQYTH